MILAWQNNWDGATLAASSALGTLPVTNTQVVHLSQKWQTVAAVKTAYVTADMGTDETKWKQSLLAVLGSNLTKNATMRLRASPSDAAAVTDVSYDSGTINAAAFKAVSLPGTAGNYLVTPDAPALDVLGDIDVRAKLDAPPSSAVRVIAARDGLAIPNRAWWWFLNSDNTLTFEVTKDGGTTDSTATSTAAVPAGYKWVRAILDVDNGAGGKTYRFYYSADGVTWVQLGADVASATTWAIADVSATLEVGSYANGANSRYTGFIYYFELRNGIDGPVVAKFDPDTDANVGDTSFTSGVTREVWTINQSGASKAAIVNVNNANLKTGYGALYKPLNTAYLRLPGIQGNYAGMPDSVASEVTGDIDVRVRLALDDWSHAGQEAYVFNKGINSRSWLFTVGSGGFLGLYRYSDGTNLVATNPFSTVATGLTAGQCAWIRVTRIAASGLTNFYTSNDGIAWTLLGAADRPSTVGAMFDSAEGYNVCGVFTKDHRGKFYYAEVRSGIDGPVVASFDPSRAAASGAISFTSKTGEVWTINQSGSPKAELIINEAPKARYWRLDLTDNTVASNLQVGRVFLGPSWTISQALIYGWSVMEVDPSNVTKSRGGQSFPDAVAKYRMLDFTLDFLSEASIFDNAFAMARAQGTVKDVLAIPLDASTYISEQSVWGRIIGQEPLIHRLSQIFRQKFTVEERL